jgi:PAS domain S-box-containing protein
MSDDTALNTSKPFGLDGALSAGGQMGELVRDFDWSTTPLGPRDQWPASLKTTVAMLLHSRHPMFLWWGQDLIQIYNDAYVPSFGRGKHPAALGQPGRACWPEIWEVIGPQIDDVMTRAKPSWHEDALVPIYRNGSLEDVYWTYGYSPVFSEDGSVGGTLVVCTETTASVLDRKRRESEQAETERQRTRLLHFFAQVPAGVCILLGDALLFDFANAAYHKLVNREQLVGLPLLQALPELAGQGLDVLLRKVMATGEPFVGHELLVRLDRAGSGAAEDRFYTFVYSPHRDPSETIDGIIVLVFEVTEQVLARRTADELAQRLRASEEQFHTLAESIPQLTWSAEPDGFIGWYNRRWYEYTGTTLEQMAGWGWKEVHDPEHLEAVIERWQRSLSVGEPFEMEFPLRRHDGVFRWHLTRAVPLRDPTGRIVRWLGTNTDIDDWRKLDLERKRLLASEQTARLAAEVASRAKDDFLTTASHELRTPLSAILGWARLLRAGKLDPSGYLRAIETIERNANVQVRLIEDILDGARIASGNLHLEIRALDLTQLVNAALDAVRHAAEAKRIQLSVTLDPAAARVIGDPDRLQQVIWNLLSNAIKFTPKGGTVTLTLERSGTNIVLRVKDDGQGISTSFLPFVFDRFRQAEGSTTRRHGGLGLGLALVRHLVEAHGGNVCAESEGEGRGATFTVSLPVQAVYRDELRASERKTPVSQQSTANLANLRGASILVVDDEPDARELVAKVLELHGAHVTMAASAASALTLLSERRYTALVSDVGMPEHDGYELMRRVRTSGGETLAALPALALTAYAREEDRRLALAAGFNDHVAKPVDPDELAQLLAGLIRRGSVPPPALSRRDAPARVDTLSKFEKILEAQGLHEALRFLNSRTPHRFTGVYKIDPPLLRNLHLLDADDPKTRKGDDMALDQAYCSIVGRSELPFSTEDSRRDARLSTHPARENVVSYCGVLLPTIDGKPFGTLCHFDLVPCEVPTREMALMEAAAHLIARYLARASG